MTPAEKLIAELSSALNNPVDRKTAEEEERMKRIFDLVPRRKRTDYSVYKSPPKSPEVVANSPEVVAKSPEVVAKSPEVVANSPEVAAKSPEVVAKSPEVAVKSPEVVANSPSLPEPINTQEWFVEVMRNMKAVGDPMHIIDKTLDQNDMDPDQNSLLMPLETLTQNDFLTPDETIIIEEDFENDGNMGVAAFLVDQRGKVWNVVLRKWFLQKSDSGRWYWSYMLRGEWSDAVKDNGMKVGDNISVWSFRSIGILCFALPPPPPPTSGVST